MKFGVNNMAPLTLFPARDGGTGGATCMILHFTSALREERGGVGFVGYSN